ncbi:MAG: hypothetical protein HC838_08885 [Spirulinaceae cyanobacterium RM2_2_10]|nr:hypothetical protein [Spirulinaceae cyanobacterium RM2_2_10]
MATPPPNTPQTWEQLDARYRGQARLALRLFKFWLARQAALKDEAAVEAWTQQWLQTQPLPLRSLTAVLGGFFQDDWVALGAAEWAVQARVEQALAAAVRGEDQEALALWSQVLDQDLTANL